MLQFSKQVPVGRRILGNRSSSFTVEPMHAISRISCVIDPTTDRQPAMDRADWLAEILGAELDLFVCFYDEYLAGDRLFESPSLDKARHELIRNHKEQLELLAEPLRGAGRTVSTAAVWDHPLHEGIVRHAHATGADIVFKDTHHHSALTRAILTNTDWNLIRSCPVPLWLVKPHELSTNPLFIAAIDPFHEHDKPAALDDMILVLAKSLAEKSSGEVHAFHAYDPRIAVATAAENACSPVSLPFDEVETQMHDEHRQRFFELAEFHGIDKQHEHLVAGLTHEELPRLANKVNADVIVMGAVARKRWKRLFIGATAERTLEHLPCDLLIVKPDWFQTPVEMSTDAAA